MPLQFYEGNQYERRSFGPGGVLEGVQRITIGMITEVDGYLEIEVRSHGFDGAGVPSDSIHTRIRCLREEADMLMNVVALVQPESRDIQLRLTGGAILYPEIATSGPLPSVMLEVTVEKGIVGFLGGRSEIVLEDRTVTLGAEESASPAPSFSISSRIELKFYVFGIRVRSKRFEAHESISPQKGLLRLAIASEDGSSAELSLVSSGEEGEMEERIEPRLPEIPLPYG